MKKHCINIREQLWYGLLLCPAQTWMNAGRCQTPAEMVAASTLWDLIAVFVIKVLRQTLTAPDALVSGAYILLIKATLVFLFS